MCIYILYILYHYLISYVYTYIYIHTSNLIKARYDVLFIVLMSEPLTMFWCWGWTSACSKSALNPQKSNLALANSALFLIWFSPWKAIYPQIGLYYYGRFFCFITPKKNIYNVTQLVSYAAQMPGDRLVRLDEASHCFMRGAPTPWLRLPAENGELESILHPRLFPQTVYNSVATLGVLTVRVIDS